MGFDGFRWFSMVYSGIRFTVGLMGVDRVGGVQMALLSRVFTGFIWFTGLIGVVGVLLFGRISSERSRKAIVQAFLNPAGG